MLAHDWGACLLGLLMCEADAAKNVPHRIRRMYALSPKCIYSICELIYVLIMRHPEAAIALCTPYYLHEFTCRHIVNRQSINVISIFFASADETE